MAKFFKSDENCKLTRTLTNHTHNKYKRNNSKVYHNQIS